MPIVPGLFAVFVASIGGWYLLVSRSAGRLEEIEGSVINRRRVRLRRTNGVLLLALSACMFALFAGVERRMPNLVVVSLLLTIVLTLATVLLALRDVSLTRQLRARLREQSFGGGDR